MFEPTTIDPRFSRDLPLTTDVDETSLVVRPSGDIDVGNAEVLSTSVLTSLNGEQRVVVDLDDVGFVDAAGLRALLICEASVSRDGASFAVRHARGEVARLLQITNTEHLLEQH